MEIKFFSGPHSGTALDLSTTAQFSLGNSYESDVYLEDPNAQIYQYIIHINLGKLIIEGGENFIKLNNGTSLFLDQEYPAPIYFSIHGIKIAIGEQLNAWAEMPPELNLETADNNVDNGFIQGLNQKLLAEEALKSKQNSNSKLSNSIRKLKAYSHSQAQNLKNLVLYLHHKYKLKFYFMLGLLLILFISITSLFAYTSSFNQQEAKHNTQINHRNQLNKKFNRLPAKFSNLILKRDNNKYIITGLIEEEKEEIELKMYFIQYENILSFKLITVKTALEKIKAILRNYNLTNLKLGYNKTERQITISGITPLDPNIINEVEIEVSNQLAYVPNINFIVYNQKQVIDDINTSLGEIVKFITIHIDLNNNLIRLNGYLTQGQLNSLTTNLNLLQDKYKGAIEFKPQIENALNALSFKIYSVYNGEQPYIVTSQGKTVYIGGKIGGFILTAITDQKLVFKGEKFTLELPLDQIMGSDNLAPPNNSNHSRSTKQDKRSQVLALEYQGVLTQLASEESQLQALRKYKSKFADNQDLKQFIAEQETRLAEDIKAKQIDLELLKQVS